MKVFFKNVLIISILFVSYNLNAQVTVSGGTSAAGSYPTLSAAITALNGGGALTAAVTVDVAAGYAETLTGRINLTATGTATNTITIQKSGAGANPILTSYVGTNTATSATMDGMFSLVGSDYVTIDGIDLFESAANTTAATMMEYGYGLFKASATDGASNNTIRNCTITLNRNNVTAPTTGPAFQGSNGITLLACTPTTMQTNLTVTAATGASSNNKFYTNTIQNVNCGICLSGFGGATPFTLCDTGNDVGGSAASTGNTIINFGGGTGATVACAAVFVKEQWSVNISYNTVDNNVNGIGGANHPNTNRGIFTNASSVGASATINNNNVTIRGGTSTTAIDWAIDCEMAQSGANGNTISINNNTLSISKTTSTAVALTAIWLQSAPTTANINNNTVTNFVSTGTSTGDLAVIRSGLAIPGTLNINGNNISGVTHNGTTGNVYSIVVQATVTTALNINGNSISGVTLSGATSKIYRGIYVSTSTSTCAVSISNNSFQNISYSGGTPTGEFSLIYGIGTASSYTISSNTLNGSLTIPTTGSTYLIYNSQATPNLSITNNNLTGSGVTRTGASGTMFAYYNFGGPSGGTANITGNTFNNITLSGTSAFDGIEMRTSVSQVHNISNNTVSNITGGSGTTYGIFHGYGQTGSTISNNTINNIISGGATYGIYIGNTTAPVALNCFSNTISSITCTGANTAYGIFHNLGTATSIYRNKIFTISATASGGSATGIHVAGATTVNIHNNIVGDIKAPSASATNPVNGFNIAGGTTINAYYNTIYLSAGSTGTNFGSTAINASTTPNLTLRNNIIVNNSTANGTGLTVAYRRSSTTLTSYNSASNNNLFYAPTLYTDGTNTDATLAAFKTRVATRDASSYYENPPFVNSSTPANADYLHLDPAIGTQAESGGVAISGFDNDFDGDVRAGSTGYAGTGTGPDLGADEGNFTLADFSVPTISSVALVGNACGATSRNVTANIFDASGVPTTGALMPRIYYSKNGNPFVSTAGTLTSGTSKNGTWTFTIDYSLVGGIAFGNTINYYIIAQDVAGTPNLVSNPTGVVATDVNTVTTPPTTLSYTQSSFMGGTYTVGAGGNFATLSDAVTAYNNSCLNAAVVFQLTDLSYSNANYSILNNVDASATNTLTIYPTNAGTVISDTSSNPTITLNGAKFVTIDGRPNATGGFSLGTNLLISNTKGTTNAIRFINEAQNNTVKYADVQSNNNNTAAASAGIILFSTTTGTNGNDNNTIDHCDIHNITGGNPVVGINANGATTTAAQNNDNITISNCNIYDYFHATNAYSGILVNGGNSTWTITDNHFFQTDIRTVTGTGFNKDIFLNNVTGNTTGSGFVITNNYIGGSNSGGTGTYTLTGTTAHQYCAIYCAVGVGTATSVQNNVITNIAFTSGSTSASAMSAITSNGGNVNIGTINGNLIGAANTDASISPVITYTNNSTTTGGFIPIFAQVSNNPALSTTNISNNTIAGISINANNANGTSAVDFNAIGYNNGDVNISNNTIGSATTPKAIYCSGAGTTSNANTSRMVGVLISGGANSSKNVTVTGNTIANLYTLHSSPGAPATTGTRGVLVIGTLTGNISTNITNNIIRDLNTFSQATTGSGQCAAGGITLTAGSIAACTVAGNSIYNLNLLGAATTGNVQAAGIFVSSAPTGTALISRNNIHSFGLVGQNPSAFLTGMDIAGGTWEISNNIIRLGIDGTGADVTVPCTVRGITKNAATSRIYHNSIYIGGQNVGSTATNTFALVRTGTAVDDWRNNILVNDRSNAGTGGKHYAINLNATTTLTLDYNNYFANGTGNVFGYNGTADVASFVPNWIAGDANSYSFDPQFINATGDAVSVNLHINPSVATIIEGTGTAIAAVTTDFDGDTRSGLTPTDMGADAGNFTSLVCSGTPAPATAIMFGNSAPICVTGTRVLSLQGFSPYPGLSLQWKESTTSGGPYSNVTAGTGATTALYTTETLSAPKYYVCAVTCSNGGASSNSSEIAVTISNPTITSSTPATRCGTGTVDLTATANAGSDINWYAAATGGAPLFTGSTFTTPSISTTTTYYVEASTSGGSNQISSNGTPTVTTSTQNGGLQFTLNQSVVLNSIQVYSSAAGTATVTLENSAGTVLFVSPALPIVNGGLTTPQTLSLGWFIPAGTGYRIKVANTGNALGYHTGTFPAQLGNGVGTITSGWVGTATSTLNYFVYNMNTTAGCVGGSRIPVVATVNTAPALTLSPNQIACASSAGTLAVVTGAADYNSYTWSPTTGLFLDNALTQPYAGGAVPNNTLYLSNPNPGSIQYTCNALNTTTGCVNTAQSTVSYGLTGTATVASQPNECPGTGLVSVNVTGAGTIVNEDFSSGILPPNMTSAGNDFALVNGRMQFTSAQNSKNGGVLITNPTGIANNDFQIDFDMITTAGSSSPADGFSYSYGPDVVALPSGTAATGTSGVTTLAPENGSGTKLKLSFDAINNTGGCTNNLPASNSNGNTAGIYLMYNETTSHQGSSCPGVLYYTNDLTWRATATSGASTHVTIKINSLGQVSMWLNGVQVVTNQQLPAAYLTDDKSTWKHAFCARTGGLNQGHYIDNLIIQYNNYYEYSLNGTSWTTNTPISAQPGTYNAQARYINFPACVANLGTVTIDPVIITASISNTSVCSGATTTLSATPIVFQGGTFQWESSPAGSSTFTPIIGATTSTYVTTVTASTDYRCVIDCGAGTTFTSNVVTVNAITPQVIATTPGTRCGLGTVDLAATANATGTIQWYAAATGGTALATGPTYTTPIITSTTTYYISAKEGTCESSRQAIDATVTPPDAINVSPDVTVCSATATQTLSVSSSNSNYTYTWDPATGLSSTTGSSVTAQPTSTTVYSITASDPVSGCVNTGSVKVTVNLTPLDPIIVPTVTSNPCKTVTKLEGTQSSLNVTAQLGTGTTTSAGNINTPYSSNWEAVRINYLITASELSALNYTAGPLTSLAFNVTTVGTSTTNPHGDLQKGYTIKIAHTNNTALADFGVPNGAYTTVYGPVDLARPTVGWNTFTFANNFIWDGVSNILIDICHENDANSACGICYNANSTVQTSTTAYNSAYGKYLDNSTSCGVSNGTIVNNTTRPNMRIGQNAPADYTWTPTTGLYTDEATTIPYTGGAAQTVWARPNTATTYTVNAVGINGCPTFVPDTETAAADDRLVELPPLGSSQVTAVNSCEDFGWTNYYINGKIFFAINWAPNGTLTGQNQIAKNSAVIRSVLDAARAQCENAVGNRIFTMKRWWNVTTSALLDPVNVRFYHDPAEVTDIMNAAAGVGPTFSWFKNNTGAFNPAIMVTGSKTGIAGGAITPLVGTTGTDKGVTYVQFDNVASFSGGTGSATTQEAALRVNAKVFLNSVDPGTGLMDDYLSSLPNFPLSDPYATVFNSGFTHVNNISPAASTTPLVLNTSGNNAIVDWVFMELRDGIPSATTVTQTRAALVQKDGDLVDVDGTSPVSFFGLPQDRYITVRHHHNLGFRTENKVSLSSTAVNLNFTNNSVPLFGSFPVEQIGTGVYAMNSGDANYDGSVDAFDTIIWEVENGLFDDYNLNSDYNMDGSVDAFDSIIWELNNGKYQEF